jgi:hypothetical protein
MTSAPIFSDLLACIPGEEFFDHQKLCPIVNLHYQAVVVMPDVENQQRFILVNIRKVKANLSNIPPNGVAGCLVPPQ